MAPRPAKQEEAAGQAHGAHDRPKRAPGHRRALDEVGALPDPDETGQAQQGSHYTPEDDHGVDYARPRTPVWRALGRSRDEDIFEVFARPPAGAPVDVAAEPSIELESGAREDLRVEVAPIVDDDEHGRVRP